MNVRRFAKVALFGCALALALPFATPSMVEAASLTEVDPQVGFTSVGRSYGSMDHRYARVGQRRSIAQVQSLAIGQTQTQLIAALGRPAVTNSDGSHEFHLNLPLTKTDRLICQYRVFVDGDKKVYRGVWRRPQCADLVLGRLN